MIFRLQGGVREVLALTPVLREWKRRKMGAVMVETLVPEVLKGNPYVDEVSEYFDRDDVDVIDLDPVEWQASLKHATESYATAVFGDSFLETWRMVMEHGVEDEAEAKKLFPVGEHKLVLGSGFSIPGCADKLREAGWAVSEIDGKKCGWRVFRAAVSMAEVYVGTQGDETVVATTTDTPVVSVHFWESPDYFLPFRKGVRTEYVATPLDVCEESPECMVHNGVFENGITYGVRCTQDPKYACLAWDMPSKVLKAVEKAVRRKL